VNLSSSLVPIFPDSKLKSVHIGFFMSLKRHSKLNSSSSSTYGDHRRRREAGEVRCDPDYIFKIPRLIEIRYGLRVGLASISCQTGFLFRPIIILHQVFHTRFGARVGEHFSDERIFVFVLDLVAAEFNVDVDFAAAFAPHFVIFLAAPA
jgi:hypothetical protein